MCTLSTAAGPSSLIATMNRDERRHRLEGPLFATSDFCYPTDAHAGGTWCGINRSGLIFCLLNRYDAPLSNAATMISRGGIIPAALECQSTAEAIDCINALDLERFNGFRLHLISRTEAHRFDWDRTRLETSEQNSVAEVFSSSSSLRSTLIPAEREGRFRALRKAQRENADSVAEPTSGVIPAAHLPDPSIPPSEAMFMVRKETHTKSICQLSLVEGSVELNYWPAQQGLDVERMEHWSGRAH